MDKLKEIENAISENDFKKTDELKDCLQRQLQEARSRDKSTDLMSLISQLPQDQLAHALFPSDHFPSLSTKETFHIPKGKMETVSLLYVNLFLSQL